MATEEDKKKWAHDWYLNNKEKVREASKRGRANRRAAVNEIKEASPCSDCGVSYPYYVMDFDHRDPSTKVKEIGVLVTCSSMQAIMDEIAKCDLVCANCHRIREHVRRNGPLA